MPQVFEIYTSPLCGYCHAAKRLLADKASPTPSIDVAPDPSRRQEIWAVPTGAHNRCADVHPAGRLSGATTTWPRSERAGKTWTPAFGR